MRFTIIVAVSMVAGTAQAATHDTQLWSVVSIGTNISGKLFGTVEFQARATDDVSRVGVVVARSSLGWRLSERLAVSGGASHVQSSARGGPDLVENNLYQQVNWTVGGVGGVTVKSRTYLEERWLDSGHDTGLRLRERVRFEHPLRLRGPVLVVSSEGFFALNSTDWGARAGFDQVRNFIGINMGIAKGVTVETGYMNRYQRRVGPDRDDHIIPMTLAVRF